MIYINSLFFPSTPYYFHYICDHMLFQLFLALIVLQLFFRFIIKNIDLQQGIFMLQYMYLLLYTSFMENFMNIACQYLSLSY